MMRLEGGYPKLPEDAASLIELYQEEEALGKRIRTIIINSCNSLLKWLQVKYGQFWLKLFILEEPAQNFLNRIQAKWRVPTGVWMPLNTYPPTMLQIHGLAIGVASLYLQVKDWKQLQDDLRKQEEPDAGWLLIAAAKERFEEGDRQMAIIHLNSALEAFVQTFIKNELKAVLPQKSLDVVVKQSHGRLLDDWVLPFCGKRNIDIDNKSIEWQSVKRVQDLRREAGHPSKQGSLRALTEFDFYNLTRHSISFICKILHQKAPKTPPPFIGASAAGT
jgi:hypothetical protein